MGHDRAGEYGTSNCRGTGNFWWWRCDFGGEEDPKPEFDGEEEPKKHPTSSRRKIAYHKRYRATEYSCDRKHERQNRKREKRKTGRDYWCQKIRYEYEGWLWIRTQWRKQTIQIWFERELKMRWNEFQTSRRTLLRPLWKMNFVIRIPH